jgi:hypothetical protein
MIAAPALPWAFIRQGTRVQFQVPATGYQLSKNLYNVSSEIFNLIPYAVSLFQGNSSYIAPARPGAFLMDDGKLWGGSCPDLFSVNQSTFTWITTGQFDSYTRGPDLFCVR